MLLLTIMITFFIKTKSQWVLNLTKNLTFCLLHEKVALKARGHHEDIKKGLSIT